MIRTDAALLRLAALVEYTDDAIISKDLDGIIESWNPAAESIFGYTADEMIGRSIRLIIPPDRQDEEDTVLRRIRGGEVVGHYETSRVRRDGAIIPVSLTVSPIRDDAGEVIGASTIMRDISERRAIERESLLLAAIVASSDDAIVSKDLNGIVQTWNAAAERMFGYLAEEAVGKPIASLIIPEDRQDEERVVLSRIRAGQALHHYDTVRRRKDGTRLEISLTVSPIRDRHGRVIGASKIARDITERNRLLRELEHANRMKDEFLATLSHELRTPLNAIMGYARILRERISDEQHRRAAEVIERNSVILMQMVSDVLDMSAVAVGKTRLSIERVNVVDVLKEAIAVVKPAADAREVTLIEEMPERPVIMTGDSRRLQQVFWNLLSNAVKFTKKGGTVTARITREPDIVRVTVTDTGVGISPDFLPHVFQRFRQADSGMAREFGGIGLGLALARHFTEMHGGTISANSQGRNKGATFEVVLPCRGL